MLPTADAGLDLSSLRALRGRRTDHTGLIEKVADYCCDYGGWVAWSGGKDSTVVVDLARRVDPQIPIVFYDCKLDFPETRTYISDLAEAWELNLHVIDTEPDLLTALIAAGDFALDRTTRRLGIDMRAAMITTPAARAHKQFGAGNLWGVRAAESTGRRQLYRTQRALTGTAGVVHRGDGTVSYGPIWNWTTGQVWEYLHAHAVPVNPVYEKLARLGADENTARVDALIDPSRLDNGHVTRLAQGWPDLYEALVEVLPRLAQYR